MAHLNIPRRNQFPVQTTYEGGKAVRITPYHQLRRAVLSCLLWEDQFYEDGVAIADRIKSLIPKVDADKVDDLAKYARSQGKLRHVPLLLARELARLKYPVRPLLAEIIQRPDELCEFLAIYWKDGKEKMAHQVKLGLADAFHKFNEYSFAKYDRDGVVKLRDVLRLCHPKPKDEAESALFKRIDTRTLAIPDTWETQLSAGKDKKETFIRLLAENKLGAMALLRNLRKMQEVGVYHNAIRIALKSMKAERVLPFRFITAARYAPDFEPELEEAMLKCLYGMERIKGRTILMVDVSGSMKSAISAKSEMDRMEAATALAILAREICEQVLIVTFSNLCVKVPPRRGFALRDVIMNSQGHGGTYLANAIQGVHRVENADRLIVFTDEQAHDDVGHPPYPKSYIVDVAGYKNSIGYGNWVKIEGFSEAVLQFICEYEKMSEEPNDLTRDKP